MGDGEVIKPQFIEDVNNILSAGEVPNLWTSEEKQNIITVMEKKAKKVLNKKSVSDDDCWDLFRTRLKSNFHVVFCMSQTGDNLRNYTRMYPGLVNNTTTIWFQRWPKEALIEVSNFYLTDVIFQEDLDE